ncbi:hypothetical protein [Sphingobacterium chuzhouense]|uniref:FUSC family protein n=1 Tax=Sphingobacterium chuzhouense TaxID=1742264 RepID=A0ABR7XUC6_9SPHI|nr:hypothetical protein [Sphingobacterium chuzhouense]MBD1422659.1 hypothetical protein [Sphingobacterium chuzhouense]
MKPNNLTEFTNNQLFQKIKNIKKNRIINAFIVGATVGIFFFGVMKNGLGVFTFFPLVIGYLVIKNSAGDKIIEQEIWKEMRSRNLV